jgi:hypothetical protein
LFFESVELIQDTDLLNPPERLLLQVLSENPDMDVYWDMLFSAVDFNYSDGTSVLGKTWPEMEVLLEDAVKMILINNQTPLVFKFLSLAQLSPGFK